MTFKITGQPVDWNSLPMGVTHMVNITPGQYVPGLPSLQYVPGLPGHQYQPHPFPRIQSTPAAQSGLAVAFKPLKVGAAKAAHISMVLDASGSMHYVWDATIEGFNAFVKGQQDDVRASGIPTTVTLYTFNGDSVTCVFKDRDVLVVPLLTRETYKPGGGTNLLDAFGGAMMAINADLEGYTEAERGSVQIVALTDGEENQSRTFTNSDIKAMVESAEAQGWGFMFLGANIDAFAVGGTLGMRFENTMSFSADAQSVGATMLSASRSAATYKHAVAEGLSGDAAYASAAFTAAERKGAKSD